MKKLVENILGPLLKQNSKSSNILMRTLGTFFDYNCSRQATAEHLRIHHKTVCYRLAKISEITGLDLNRHEDRLLADVALRIHTTLSN